MPLLAAQAAFGLFANDEILEAGPFAGIVSKAISLGLTSLHRKLFYVIAGAAALHVGAVLWHWRMKGENLIAAMITGKNRRISSKGTKRSDLRADCARSLCFS